ncbi:MAG TPA: response regulator [Gammaproteobacteria bacterium]|nr:response regulator [Gammaproteobacteria bacterium]
MQRKILLVDDEKMNLEIMEGYLRLGENADHTIIKASNGQEGLEFLKSQANEIDAILLDRMMPHFSGIDFLKERNKDEELKNIPVIMQTASTSKENMLESFKHGAYHYLIKPYSPTIFNSIVRSAINFYSKYRDLTSVLQNSKTLFSYVNEAEFRIVTPEDADLLSLSLARLFPNPDRVVFGIFEISLNAIEHGNLSITYDEKTELNISGKWREEVHRRLKLEENVGKEVILRYFKKNGEIVLNIKDQGEGFDFKKYLDFDLSRSTDNHGRGIAFAKALSFDRLEYVEPGNEVNCIVKQLKF